MVKAIKRSIHQDLRKQSDIGLEKSSLYRVAGFENFLILVEMQELNSVSMLIFSLKNEKLN